MPPPAPIGAERRSPHLPPAGNSNSARSLAGGGIPEAQGAVVAGRGEQRAVGAEGDVVDAEVVSPGSDRTSAPVRASRISTVPDPRVPRSRRCAHRGSSPRGLLRQGRSAPASMSHRLVERLDRLGQHLAALLPRRVDRGEGEQDAALRVIGPEAADGCAGQGAVRWRRRPGSASASLRWSTAMKPPTERDDEGDADHPELRPQSAVGPGLAGDSLGLGVLLLAVPLLPAGGRRSHARPAGGWPARASATSSATWSWAPR